MFQLHSIVVVAMLQRVQADPTKHQPPIKSPLGTNLIHDFTTVTFSVKLGVVHEKLTLL